ncbi:MAG: exodeoxyribonuclease VII small subunit [bacterium]
MSAKGQKQNFEDDLKKLEEIVKKIESGEAPLEETVRLFEEGIRIAKGCQKFLEEAEMKVTKLVEGEEERTAE